MTQRIELFLIWLKELNHFFSDMTQRIVAFIKSMFQRNETFFVWLKDLNTFFFSMWLKELNPFFLNMTLRNEPFFLEMTQRIEPSFLHNSKTKAFLTWLKDLSLFF